MPASTPGYLVFRKSDADQWELLGEATRRPGQTARAARRGAIIDVTGREPSQDEVFAAVLRSEWRIATEY